MALDTSDPPGDLIALTDINVMPSFEAAKKFTPTLSTSAGVLVMVRMGSDGAGAEAAMQMVSMAMKNILMISLTYERPKLLPA